MTIAITSSGISLDGPLVAGEKVAVTVSGLALAAEDKPTLALLARFPDALLASVELAESETAGTWTGELDTATKQTALFFATARADERRDAALELVAGRVSLARLTVPMANSALCPKPDGSPFASPVYVPVPGPPGQGGDPYDQAPQMDGEASAGVSDEYARGDHRHPTDETRQAVVGDLAAIRSGAAAGATAVQPAALSAYRTAAAQDAIDGAQDTEIAAKYTKPATGIPASDLASGVLPTALPNPETLHIGAVEYDGSTEEYVPGATTSGDYGIVTLEAATNSTNADGYAATPLAVKTVADSVAGKASSASVAPALSTSSTYAVGDYVTHEGLLYKCTTAVSTAGAWNAADWTAVSVTDEMGGGGITGVKLNGTAITPDAQGAVDVLAVPWANANKNAATIGTRNNETIAGDTLTVGLGCEASEARSAAFGDGSMAKGLNSFAVGEGCWAGGKDSFVGGWKAASTKSGVNHWGAFVWNGSGTGAWYSSHGDGTFNVSTQGGAAGFYVGEDSLASLLRYSFAAPTPSVSGASATVACEDRAINDFTVAMGITSLTITPPAAVTGRARDFFCRVTLTDSSLPTVTLSGATIDIGASEVAGMTQGVNLLMFTEISSGHWLASRRSAS